jgi:hypothetical protein
MDKRYLIFISSTYEDLKVEREKVTRAIMDLNNIPARMENFPAAGIRPKDLIERVIRECDYFVLIIGSRYGSISDSGKSYTEEEYNYAVHEGIPVIAFIQDGIINNHDDDYKRLLEFKERVKHGTHTIRTWTSPDQLMAIVATSLHNAININPRPGWVRADAGNSAKEEFDNQIKEPQSRNKLLDGVEVADGETVKSDDNSDENSDFWRTELSAHLRIGFDYWDRHFEIPYSIKLSLKEWFIPIATSINDSVSDVTVYGIVYDLSKVFYNDPYYKKTFMNCVYNYINSKSSKSLSGNIIYQTRKLLNTGGLLPNIKGIEINDRDIKIIIQELQKEGLIEKEIRSDIQLSEKGEEYLEKFVYQEN